MTQLKHKAKWYVSLSNGETHYEDKGIFKVKEGEKSPWQRLDRYCIDNRLEVTSLGLYTDDGRRFNLPSAGNRPNFPIFYTLTKPLDYACFRALTQGMSYLGAKPQKENLYTVIEAIYSNHKLQLWVDEDNINNCWCVTVPIVEKENDGTSV
jgi:hypothetical protein